MNDLKWFSTLHYRHQPAIEQVAARFERHGLTPDVVGAVLSDNGEGLIAAGLTRAAGWEEPYGGLYGVALLTAELNEASTWWRSQLAAARQRALQGLAADHSIADISKQLGVSRQAVSKAVHGAHDITGAIVAAIRQEFS